MFVNLHAATPKVQLVASSDAAVRDVHTHLAPKSIGATNHWPRGDRCHIGLATSAHRMLPSSRQGIEWCEACKRQGIMATLGCYLVDRIPFCGH